MEDRRFGQLIAEALEAGFSGWDFSYLSGRWVEEEPPWSYRERVVALLRGGVRSLLDMGTGGGEFLASLAPLPPASVATEAYAPNVPVAARRLHPLGVRVVAIGDDERLPFADDSFDAVINRHESYVPSEVFRILRPGGRFITQQVGELETIELNEQLQARVHGRVTPSYPGWNLDTALAGLVQAGFEIVDRREAFPRSIFYDIGAVVYYLRAVPWQIPDFSVEAYRDALFALHRRIEAEGALVARAHRFYIEARKPVFKAATATPPGEGTAGCW